MASYKNTNQPGQSAVHHQNFAWPDPSSCLACTSTIFVPLFGIPYTSPMGQSYVCTITLSVWDFSCIWLFQTNCTTHCTGNILPNNTAQFFPMPPPTPFSSRNCQRCCSPHAIPACTYNSNLKNTFHIASFLPTRVQSHQTKFCTYPDNLTTILLLYCINFPQTHYSSDQEMKFNKWALSIDPTFARVAFQSHNNHSLLPIPFLWTRTPSSSS